MSRDTSLVEMFIHNTLYIVHEGKKEWGVSEWMLPHKDILEDDNFINSHFFRGKFYKNKTLVLIDMPKVLQKLLLKRIDISKQGVYDIITSFEIQMMLYKSKVCYLEVDKDRFLQMILSLSE